MRRLIWLVLALVVTGCGSNTAATDEGRAPLTISTSEGAVVLHVEIADTSDERAEGLSRRASLPPDAGMAFLWDEPVVADFWMKDTLIPLQIVFWDRDHRIVAMFDMDPCTEEPCPTYGPKHPVVGAAEANAGWFTGHDVRVGDTVELDA